MTGTRLTQRMAEAASVELDKDDSAKRQLPLRQDCADDDVATVTTDSRSSKAAGPGRKAAVAEVPAA